MDELKGLGGDKWYRALAVMSCTLLLGAAALANDPALRRALIQVGVGGLLVGFGQWIDHPYQARTDGYWKVSGYPYKPSVVGSMLTLAGVVVLARAAWQLW